MKIEIPLTQNKVAIIDKEDAELISNYKWYANKRGGTFYALTNVRKPDGKRTILSMHRLLLSNPIGIWIDHRDGNGLNNCRSNLRLVTGSQNQANSRLRVDNKSGFKGVCWNRQVGKWQVYITVKGNRIHLGLFDDKEKAGSIYDKAAEKYFGKYAYTNNSI
jgi:HNH endonuclease